MSSGRVFQSLGPATANERSPTVTRRDRGMTTPDPVGELTALPRPRSWWGGGMLPLPETHPVLGPAGVRVRSLVPWAEISFVSVEKKSGYGPDTTL